MAVLFGVGAALTLDEFALWLNLKDVYWEKEGRISIDSIVIAFTILLGAFAISERHEHKEVRRFWKRIFRNRKV